MNGRFLPGVPGAEIERILNAAPGNEITSGKFDSPESSSALVANAFGFYLHRAVDLPVLPGCEEEVWPARSLSMEAKLRFPWRGGRHPFLDCLVETPSALIGIESKRFEPYRSSLSDAFWRPVWGEHMGGYEGVRDRLRDNPAGGFAHLDAAQLFKHALALRSEVYRREPCKLKPILFYLYAEPEVWPRNGEAVDEQAKARHREEIEAFGKAVGDDEVSFVWCPWRNLLDTWASQRDSRTRAHAQAVRDRFLP
ncbi:MAG: hypothetical protein F4Y86_07500 [Gammaproteobacteria bacterium]|nr:hypothetical protein [Gammaproteobacteria bacterium]